MKRDLSAPILDLAKGSLTRRESVSERTKVIKIAVCDSRHDLSSIGMQTPSISRRVGSDIEAARRLESESQRSKVRSLQRSWFA